MNFSSLPMIHRAWSLRIARLWAAQLERKVRVGLPALLVALLAFGVSRNVFAHGERAQEPSLRLSTIQWYDTQWSRDQVRVNQELTLSGRFHVMANWPLEVPSP